VTALRLGELGRRALDRAGLLDRLFWLRARLGRRELAVLTYHRLGHPDDAGELDPGVFESTPDELAAQLDVLRAHATVVSLADVRRFFRGRRMPPNPVLITFDDGYADVPQRVLPVLRKAGVPATFFIPTAFPDAGRLFWWDRIWLLVQRCRRDRVELHYPERLVLDPLHAPAAAARALCWAVKRTERLDLTRLWDGFEQDAGVALDAAEERALAARTILSWGAVRRLRGAGMDVQSHSHDHIILNSLSLEAAQRDLARSARVLREALGEEVYAVAYPVGYELAGPLRGVPPAAGFELGFTNGTGLCAEAHLDALNVPRISMDLGMGIAGYKARVLFGDRRWAHPTWTPAAGSAAEPPDPPGRASAEVRGP
jgi:peptidoglycan/xylan/chitin deacetylase (PgdA/CDA1 family)